MSFMPEESPNLAKVRDAKNRVNDLPRGNFILAYHPDDWQVDQDGRLMPTLVHLGKEPGNGAVSPDGDFTQAEVEYSRRGFVMIPHDVLGDTDYVAKYTNRKGKAVHRTIFQQGYNDATGITRWAHDAEAHREFVAYLRLKGIIKQPTPQVVAGLLEVQKSVLEALRPPRTDDGLAMERYTSRAEKVKRNIASLEAELKVSEQVYGAARSPGHKTVRSLLRSLVDQFKDEPARDADFEDDEDSEEEPRPPRPGQPGGPRETEPAEETALQPEPVRAQARPPRGNGRRAVVPPPSTPAQEQQIGPDADEDE